MAASNKRLAFLTDSKIVFYFALAAGACALATFFILLYTGWSVLTFNAANFQSEIQTLNATYNSSVAQIYQTFSNITVLAADALYLFLPLVAIAGALMLFTAFQLKSKHKKKVLQGVMFSAIFSVFVLFGVLVYLMVSPSIVAVLFSYISPFQAGGGYSPELTVAYFLFLAYIVLGLLSSILGLYRSASMHD